MISIPLSISLSVYTLLMALFLAGFLAAIPGPKPAYFSGPSTNLSSLQKFVLRHIRHPYRSLPLPCPISTEDRSRSRTENFPKIFSQKFWPLTFSQFFRKSPASHSAEFAPSRIFPQNPPKPPVMLPSEEIFPNFFFQIFSRKFQTLLPRYILHSEEIFPKKNFPKFLGALRGLRKSREMLDREKIFPKFFLRIFGNPGLCIQVKRILSKRILSKRIVRET